MTQLGNRAARGMGAPEFDLRTVRRDATNGANVVLTADDPQFISLNPTAARDVTLPALQTGLLFYIANRAASGSGFNLVVKSSGGVTLATIPPLAAAMCYSSANGWLILLGAAVTVQGG